MFYLPSGHSEESPREEGHVVPGVEPVPQRRQCVHSRRAVGGAPARVRHTTQPRVRVFVPAGYSRAEVLGELLTLQYSQGEHDGHTPINE